MLITIYDCSEEEKKRLLFYIITKYTMCFLYLDISDTPYEKFTTVLEKSRILYKTFFLLLCQQIKKYGPKCHSQNKPFFNKAKLRVIAFYICSHANKTSQVNY